MTALLFILGVVYGIGVILAAGLCVNALYLYGGLDNFVESLNDSAAAEGYSKETYNEVNTQWDMAMLIFGWPWFLLLALRRKNG